MRNPFMRKGRKTREKDMATIGTFKKSGNDYTGEIVTLFIRSSGVRILEEPKSNNDKAPSHRVFVGRAEIGAGWTRVSEDGREYVSLKLDEPSFNAPIFANLIDDGEDEYKLIWSRQR
jgi:uncharacterized protein (DUF736 family)